MTKKAIATKTSRIKTKERSLTIEDAISEALGELTTLGEEMREAYDNTPESLQSSGVGEMRGEAADNLENINEPDVPSELEGEKFMVTRTVRVLSPSAQRKQSRSDRRHEAIETLNAVISCLEEIDDNKEATAEEKEAASSFKDDVQTVIDEAEGVDFPGMYG